jgi:hypothetical protein
VTEGKCGFILREEQQELYVTDTLCTDSEDYSETGLHLHDIISGHDMYGYFEMSGYTPDGYKVKVAGGWSWWYRWISNVWMFDVQVPLRIAYNVADYLITKPE